MKSSQTPCDMITWSHDKKEETEAMESVRLQILITVTLCSISPCIWISQASLHSKSSSWDKIVFSIKIVDQNYLLPIL